MKTRGFTLIELLVVISIISLLSSVVLASVKDARSKALDRKVIIEVNQLMTALELYKNDNGQYPKPPGNPSSYYWGSSYNTGSSIGDPPTYASQFETQMLPYMKTLPKATVNVPNIYYHYNNNGSSFATCQSQNDASEYQILLQTNSSSFSKLPYQTTFSGGYQEVNTSFKCISVN